LPYEITSTDVGSCRDRYDVRISIFNQSVLRTLKTLVRYRSRLPGEWIDPPPSEPWLLSQSNLPLWRHYQGTAAEILTYSRTCVIPYLQIEGGSIAGSEHRAQSLV